MGTLITTSPLDWKVNNSSRTYAVLPNGNLLILVWKTMTTFVIYETSDRVNFNLRGTFTVSASYSTTNPANRYAIELTHDGTILHVVYRCADFSVKHRAITVATWAATVEAVVYPATASITIYTLDISVSLGGAVICAMIYAGPAGDRTGYITRIRTTAGSWLALEKVTVNASTYYKSWVTEIVVEWYRNTDAANRRYSVLWSAGLTTADAGVRLTHCSVNETTGASLSSKYIGTLAQGTISGGTWSNLSFIGPARRTIMRSIPNSLNKMALGINGSKVASATLVDNLSAGVISIQTLGVNAVADTIDTSSIFSAPSFFKVNSARGHQKSITVAYDDNNNLTFNFVNPDGGPSTPGYMVSRVMKIRNPASASPYLDGDSIKGLGDWDVSGPTTTFGGSDHALVNNIRHDTLSYSPNGNITLSSSPALSTSSPRPATGEVVATSLPAVGGKASTPKWVIGAPRFFAQYQIASDVGFTANSIIYKASLKSYNAYAGSLDGPVTSFEDPWLALPIPAGYWYYRVRVGDLYGAYSPWSTNTGTFQVSHPAAAFNIQPPYLPDAPRVVAYLDAAALGYTEVPVAWEFSDSYANDFQTKYRVQVFSSASAVIYDTGLITSAVKKALIRVPFANRNEILSFSVYVEDQYSTGVAVSSLSQYGSLMTYAPAEITVFTPTSVDASGNVNTNAPNFNYTYLSSLYDIVRLDLTVMKNGVPILTASLDNPPVSGVINTLNQPVLQNNTDYSAILEIVDINGLKGSKTLQIRTLWSPPPAPGNVTVTTGSYNVENGGYITIGWDNSTEVVDDFINYSIYRVVDQLDQNGAPIGIGQLELLQILATSSISYQYLDYFAPSNTRVGYVVTQTTNVFGSIKESSNLTPTYVFPVSDGYWLIDPTPEDILFSAFKLSNVTEDAYSDNYEEEAIQIIGRGRHFDRGDNFGIEGSLTAQLRNTGNTTARVKKLRIEKIKSEARSLFLRTPFGDTWYVNIGQIGIARVAGVGLNEFVDVSVPYSEVYE